MSMHDVNDDLESTTKIYIDTAVFLPTERHVPCFVLLFFCSKFHLVDSINAC